MIYIIVEIFKKVYFKSQIHCSIIVIPDLLHGLDIILVSVKILVNRCC